MKVVETPLEGLFVIEPKVFGDDRGFFLESYNEETFKKAGLHTHWVQDNHSRSSKNVLRGLHFQNPMAQIKLVRVVAGSVLDVVVDVRPNSRSFGQHFAVELSSDNKKWLYVPKGFAHGFLVLSESVDFLYKCSDFYAPQFDGGILWNDPDLGIEWPCKAPVLSAKDAQLPRLKDLPKKDFL
jgi:dTDP-4-dehydrorhamnose 3,5-epimerase